MNSIQRIASSTIFVILLSLLSTKTSFAADFSDTEGPKIQLKMIQSLPSRGNVIIFEVNVTDNKNEVKKRVDGVSSVLFDTRNKQIAPVCNQSQIFAGARIQMFSTSPQVKIADGSFQSKWNLILYFNSFPPLPATCPEWRKGGASLFDGPYFEDAAGNKTWVLDYNSKDNEAVIQSYRNNLDNLLITAQDDVYCFVPPFDSENQSIFASGITRFKDSLKPFRGKGFATKLLGEFDSRLPKYEENAEKYLQVGKSSFSIQSLESLPLCANALKYRYEVYPALSSPFNDYFQDLLKLLASAKAQSEAGSSKEKSQKQISCQKKNEILKVSGKSPKCPKGYRKK